MQAVVVAEVVSGIETFQDSTLCPKILRCVSQHGWFLNHKSYIDLHGLTKSGNQVQTSSQTNN